MGSQRQLTGDRRDSLRPYHRYQCACEHEEDRISIDLQTRVSAAASVISTELDGDAVLMHVDRGLYFGLNPVGAHIWKLMASPIAVAELCVAVLSEFDVTQEVCERDVLNLLSQFQEHGLVGIDDHAD